MSGANGVQSRNRSVENEPDRHEEGRAQVRTVPHNLEAEESLIGAMLLSRDAIVSAIELQLTTEAFWGPTNALIFTAIVDLWARGEGVDPVTVAEEMRRTNTLEKAGGQPAIVARQANTPAIGNASRYAKILERHVLLRKLIGVGGLVAELGWSAPPDAVDIVELLDAAEQLVFALRPRREAVTGRSIGEAINERLDTIDAMIEEGGVVQNPTGFIDLDEMTAGVHPSTLTLVAGRPGMGKSAFGLALTRNVAGAGRPVVFVSVEMSEADLVDRMLGAEASVAASDIRRGNISRNDRERLNTAAAAVGPLPVHVVDAAGATMLTVRTEVRRAMSRYGSIGLVVLDYVQIMKSAGKVENRQVEVAQLAQGARALARELKVPVVALAQLSRSLELRGDKRPQLSDLRESGDLENTADVVIGLYRDEKYNPDTEDLGMAELVVLKQRQGPTGTVKLAADLRIGRWSNLARTTY